MITLSAFKWIRPFTQGTVRDLRARWVLEEAGIPYQAQLIVAEVQANPDYRSQQPFGQVPIYTEDDLVLFESGAIVLHLGKKRENLLELAR